MLSLRSLHLAYDTVHILRGVDLDVAPGEILCLLGKSGSGKTTILRVIAGLEENFEGEIAFDGQSLRGSAPHERGFGLMFQDFALFPHMSVAQNITFGLRMQQSSRSEQQQRLDDLLDLVGLATYGDRDVTQLSGGEQQRVALARSLAPQPRLLMLDEPLGALDAGLRQRLVGELRRIIKQIGLTAIYVTHDQEEAYGIADRIAVMNAGRIEQIDTPQQLYHQPKNAFVARFLGLTNILSRAELVQLALTPLDDAPHYLLHPRGIVVDDHGPLAGVVTESAFKGERYALRASIQDVSLSFTTAAGRVAWSGGDSIRISIQPDAIVPLANPALSD